ncbi:hypothetical protein MMC30_008546 [Trapelia coarctata]|nr:hypothetical protein [Trapelia coarctata]
MNNLIYDLGQIDTAISDLADTIQTSKLSSREDTTVHLDTFQTENQAMIDQLLKRNAETNSVVNQVIRDNDRTTLLLHEFANQANKDISFHFQDLFQLDREMLGTLSMCRAELDRAIRSFGQDSVHVQQTRNQDREFWSIFHIAARGEEQDMGQVERNTATLQHVEVTIPPIEGQFQENARTMKEGVEALKTFRKQI